MAAGSRTAVPWSSVLRAELRGTEINIGVAALEKHVEGGADDAATRVGDRPGRGQQPRRPWEVVLPCGDDTEESQADGRNAADTFIPGQCQRLLAQPASAVELAAAKRDRGQSQQRTLDLAVEAAVA